MNQGQKASSWSELHLLYHQQIHFTCEALFNEEDLAPFIALVQRQYYIELSWAGLAPPYPLLSASYLILSHPEHLAHNLVLSRHSINASRVIFQELNDHCDSKREMNVCEAKRIYINSIFPTFYQTNTMWAKSEPKRLSLEILCLESSVT